MRKIYLENSWKERLLNEFEQKYMKSLSSFLREEKSKGKIIFPTGKKIFNAFSLTKFDEVKVVILGQDPYHGPGQAHGLSFSVESQIKKPPSLINIFKELHSDLGYSVPDSGNLEKWGKQGVLLLNSVLTVERGKPGSHFKRGWEDFTDKILKILVAEKTRIVYVLWGKRAQEKKELIDLEKNLIISTAHPSPLSANNGFFGSKPFSKINDYLKKHEIEPVKWNLD